MDKDKFIQNARRLLAKDSIEDVIFLIENFLNENKIDDKDIFDSLIVASSSIRRVTKSYNLGKILYEDLVKESNKVIIAISSIIDDIALFKISAKEYDDNESKSLTFLTKSQNQEISALASKMIDSDKLIAQLSFELKEKEKEIINITHQSEIVFLKEKIQNLQEKIKQEEEKYYDLHKKYQELQTEKLHLADLKKDIENYKQQLSLRKEHIDILVQNEIWNKLIIEELKEIINSLKKK